MRPSNGLNAGITDARFALQWTQKYAHLFGGDKTKVTVWGQSSGGGTVLHLVGAEEGRKEKLFRSSVVSSPYLVPMGSCDQTAFEVSSPNLPAVFS
jgi:carboxylesterase type B